MIKESLKVTAFGLSVMAFSVLLLFWPAKNSVAPVELSSEDLSWIEFCKARGYDIHTDDPETVNEFLDTWRGSVEEENAFNNLEALPA